MTLPPLYAFPSPGATAGLVRPLDQALHTHRTPHTHTDGEAERFVQTSLSGGWIYARGNDTSEQRDAQLLPLRRHHT